MGRKSEKLYDAITNIGDDLIEDAQRTLVSRCRVMRWIRPAAAAALCLAVILIGNSVLGRSALTAYAISEAVYPQKTSTFPKNDRGYEEQMGGFLSVSIPEFLSETGGKNRVYSPVNVYIALSMLAEVTDGESRSQILSLLGTENIEEQRELSREVWENIYYDGEYGKTVLANSLWLNQEINFVPETMDTLAKDYYVSTYQGAMGSDKFDRAFRTWLNEQTGGFLKDQTKGEAFEEDTCMTIASCVYFRGKWQYKFKSSNTTMGVFHGAEREINCDFMNQKKMKGTYFWGEKFGAVRQNFMNGSSMWYFLPDEGITAEELIQDEEFLSFAAEYNGRSVYQGWGKEKEVFINLSVPKFDISSGVDLIPGLKKLGVTDVMDLMVSDYSPMTKDTDLVWLSGAEQVARVIVDEDGCTAVSYVKLINGVGSSAPPDDEIDFVLDRPFIFMIAGKDSTPLFVGIVNNPAE